MTIKSQAVVTRELHEKAAEAHLVAQVSIQSISSRLDLDFKTVYEGIQRYAPTWVFSNPNRVDALRREGRAYRRMLLEQLDGLAENYREVCHEQ